MQTPPKSFIRAFHVIRYELHWLTVTRSHERFPRYDYGFAGNWYHFSMKSDRSTSLPDRKSLTSALSRVRPKEKP